MPEQRYDETRTEAVAVFHDAGSLQDAVDDLLTRGFDHAELSVLANEQASAPSSGATTCRRPSSRTIPTCRARR